MRRFLRFYLNSLTMWFLSAEDPKIQVKTNWSLIQKVKGWSFIWNSNDCIHPRMDNTHIIICSAFFKSNIEYVLFMACLYIFFQPYILITNFKKSNNHQNEISIEIQKEKKGDLYLYFDTISFYLYLEDFLVVCLDEWHLFTNSSHIFLPWGR